MLFGDLKMLAAAGRAAGLCGSQRSTAAALCVRPGHIGTDEVWDGLAATKSSRREVCLSRAVFLDRFGATGWGLRHAGSGCTAAGFELPGARVAAVGWRRGAACGTLPGRAGIVPVAAADSHGTL
ncbi:MAG: hypothetical protein R2864_09015 [Syntrophotaleaceae bacterium]